VQSDAKDISSLSTQLTPSSANPRVVPLHSQKWTGAAYTSNLLIPRSNFGIVKGSPKHYVVVGDSGKNNDHFFCGGELLRSPTSYLPASLFCHPSLSSLAPDPQPECGSSLYTALEILPEVYCVKSGGIDDPEIRRNLEIKLEIYTKDRVGFAKELEGAQQDEAFGGHGK
jgi:hypothetical protein